MVCSLDGYIAKKDGDLSWMESTGHYEKGIALSSEEVARVTGSIDCYIMGSRTYEQALRLGWPYGDKPVYVMTSRRLESERANVHFCGEGPETIVRQLRRDYENTWLVGGAKLANACLRLDLADDIIISVMPVLLGDGIPFFGAGTEKRLQLKDVTAYRDGMVELKYGIR